VAGFGGKRVDSVNLLEARELRKSYARSTGFLAGDGEAARFTAVDGVSFGVVAGERLRSWGEWVREDYFGADHFAAN